MSVSGLSIMTLSAYRPGQTLIVHGQVAELDGKDATLRYWGEDEQGNRVLSKGEAELELAG